MSNYNTPKAFIINKQILFPKCIQNSIRIPKKVFKYIFYLYAHRYSKCLKSVLIIGVL